MGRLQEAPPEFDQRSLLNATFVMRQKGLITFDKSSARAVACIAGNDLNYGFR
jgi:hypothetical protein